MDPFTPRQRRGPEAAIQKAIVTMLENRGWFVVETHGNAYQKGVPDLAACHAAHGHRWIEVKNPEAYSFTAAQRITFPKFSRHGAGVWILIAATEHEYLKLLKPANWFEYLKLHHGVQSWNH